MKRIYRILGLMLFMFVLSCDLDKDLNDPNEVGLDTADPTLLMNAIQADFASFFSRIAGNDNSAPSSGVNQLMRMEAMTGGDTYALALNPEDFDEAWEDAYQNVLVNIDAMLPLAKEDNLTTHVAAGMILKAYTLMILVDVWGDVPATEAGKGSENLNPAADAGSDVYDMAMAYLDSARTELAKTGADIGPPLTRDNYYGIAANPSAAQQATQRSRWAALANTLEMRAWVNISTLTSRAGEATAAITSLLSSNLIDTPEENFMYKYGTANIPVRSRHPQYTDDYRAQAGATNGYIGTYFLKQVYNGTGIQDPRWRYYFSRQAGSIDRMLEVDGESVPCVLTPAPNHYATEGQPFCVFEPGFFGRDHGNNDGGPPDANVVTAVGVYPAGGRLDLITGPDEWVVTQQGQGANGAGVEPLWMYFFTDFLKGEAAIRLGTAGDPVELLKSGVQNSIDYVKTFAAERGQTLPAELDLPALSYVTRVSTSFETAAAADKLDVFIKEFYKAAWGNGIEAYNMYRRTSSPRDIQPTRAENGGAFFRTLIYPAVYANLNANATQKTSNDVKTFWDGNPDVLR